MIKGFDEEAYDGLRTRLMLDQSLWRHLTLPNGGDSWISYLRSVRALLSCEKVGGKTWIHLSISRPDGVPSYEDLASAKDHFIGPARHAVMVLPREDEHVNDHPNVLHLFAPIDGSRPVPDFRREHVGKVTL